MGDVRNNNNDSICESSWMRIKSVWLQNLRVWLIKNNKGPSFYTEPEGIEFVISAMYANIHENGYLLENQQDNTWAEKTGA